LKNKIAQLTWELQYLKILDNHRMITDIDKEKKEKIQDKIILSVKVLNKLEYHQWFQQKYRYQKKQRLQLIEKQIKEAGFDTQLVRPMVGHPSLEEAQPGLLETIVQILQEALTNMNYKLSCSATYLKLIPRWHNTNEGRQHVKTVPVKLLKSQNMSRKSHNDTRFCAALIRNLKEMVSLLGPKCALVISQDDKARISLVPILMRLEYRIELPDHDWVVAERHKLIPSVYTILDIQESKYGHADVVTYLGPTFIRICSSKHDSSTTYSHGKDFDNLISEEQLRNYTTTINEQPKLVVVILNDSGPDENPQYKKTIQIIIEHFDKYDLDTIIVACFVLYQSTLNPVERQIASLSHDLASVILLHDMFGTHLDSQLKTNDDELEKCNFKAAGNALTSIWKNTIIDSYPVLIKYIDPSEEHHYPSEKSESWIENNEGNEAMWVEKASVPNCISETYYQKIQVQKKLVVDKVLIVN
ncbi:13386_t:CDS:2, partial [Dentiscutata erythropus]